MAEKVAHAKRQLVHSIVKSATEKVKVELADAHCHLDIVRDPGIIEKAVHDGVLTLITNGVNTSSNKKALELSDGINIFPALGIDPEFAVKIGDDDLDDEIEANVKLIEDNKHKVVSIGEIGLDYTKAKTPADKAKQRTVFERFIDLANKLDLPVSVHSRDSMDNVLEILMERKAKKVHLHFFEGNVAHAKLAERNGYMISIPPLDSGTRQQVIRNVAIDYLMVESDCPAVAKSPFEVQFSAKMIAALKGLTYEKAAETLTLNTKRFFGIHKKEGFMRA